MSKTNRLVEVPIGKLPPPDKINAPMPSAAFVATVEEHGIMQSIVVASGGKGVYELYAGRRRLLAAHEAGLKHVPCTILPDGIDKKTIPHIVALIENHHRSANAQTDMIAIENLMKSGLDRAGIADATGISIQVIDARMTIKEGLTTQLYNLFKKGSISEKVAKACLLLGRQGQNAAAKLYKKEAKLTAAMVREMRLAEKDDAVADIPDDILYTPDASEETGKRNIRNLKAIKKIKWADVSPEKIQQIISILGVKDEQEEK